MTHVDEDSSTARREERVEQPAQPRYLQSLRWALAEIGVVTVGILIAFSLNAWWDGRSMMQQEQVHLRALASDFEQNVEELRRLVALQQRVASSSLELLERANNGGNESSATLEPMMAEVFNSARFEPVMGAYEGLVNAGGLTLIRDDALRATLAYFAAQVRNRYAENWSNEHYFALSREFGGRFLLGVHTDMTVNERERQLEAMLRDPAFQSHLALRYYSERDMARHYAGLLEQAEHVLHQVRAELRD